jgi:hypothetical protein
VFIEERQQFFIYGGSNTAFLSDLWRFDFASQKWDMIATNSIQPRNQASILYLSSVLYLLGGVLVQPGHPRVIFDDVYSLLANG